MNGGAGVIPLDSTPAGPIFNEAVRWIISAEGQSKLVNDVGGLTRFGISQRANPDIDVTALTREGAEEIFLKRYWRPIRGSALPPAVALVVFDAAVNMGIVTSTRILQTVLRKVPVDGIMGPETVGATKVFLPITELVALALELRLRWYQDLVDKDEASKAKYGKYLYGWRMRIMRLAIEAGRWRGL